MFIAVNYLIFIFRSFFDFLALLVHPLRLLCAVAVVFLFPSLHPLDPDSRLHPTFFIHPSRRPSFLRHDTPVRFDPLGAYCLIPCFFFALVIFHPTPWCSSHLIFLLRYYFSVFVSESRRHGSSLTDPSLLEPSGITALPNAMRYVLCSFVVIMVPFFLRLVGVSFTSYLHV